MREKESIQKNIKEQKYLTNSKVLSLLIISLAIVLFFLVLSIEVKGEINRPTDANEDNIFETDPMLPPWTIQSSDPPVDFKSDEPECVKIIIFNTGNGGGIIVEPGGELILDDIDLEIQSGVPPMEILSEIRIEGKFEFKDTDDGTANIYAANADEPYKFTAGGTTILENAIIEDLWGDTETGQAGGIIINSNNVKISDCTIAYNTNEAINCTNYDLEIEDTEISNNLIGMFIRNTDDITANNLEISDNDIGIVFYDASPTFNDTLISDSDENSIACNRSSSPIFENCTIEDDIYLSEDSHLYAVVTNIDGDINFDDDLSDLTVQWFVNLTTLVANTEDIVPYADIKVKEGGPNGEEFNFKTDSIGKRKWVKLTEYVQSFQLGQDKRTPHTIEADKYESHGEIEVDIEVPEQRVDHIIYIPIPDLKLYGNEISFSTSTNVSIQEEIIQITARIKNIGVDGSICNVNFYYYNENDGPGTKKLIDTVTDFFVPGESEADAELDWDIGLIDTGYYYINVTIEDADPREINENNNDADSSITYRIITRPDLNFTKWESKEDISISNYEPAEGDKIILSATVHNIGDENANCDVNFYYEPKNSDEFTLFATQNIDVNGVIDGNNEKNSGDVELDTTGLHGEYIIQVKIENADPSESDTNNNIIEDYIYVYSKPDLNFTDWDKEDFNISDDEPMESDIVEMNATVHNLGESNASCVVEFKYRLINKEAYTEIGRSNIEVKGIGWGVPSFTNTGNITWDTAGFYGEYIVNITIKNSNPQESNEENNYYEHIVRIYSRPDLNFTNWETKEDFYISNHAPNEGEDITMNITVQNLGEIKSNYCNVTFYYKMEGTNNPYTEIETVQITVDGNMSGNNQTVTKNITWNTDGSRGWNIIKVLIHDSEPTERFENNNEIFYRIYIYGKPEMIVKNITFSKNDPLKDEKIEINACIQNLGDNDAENFKVTFYDNEIIQSNEIDSKTTTVKGHSMTNITIEWTTTSEGDHTIWVDITEVPNESNPNNNNKSAFIHVNTHPDLTLNYQNNITFSNNAPDEDDSIVIFANITNIADANGTATVKFYDDEIKKENLIGEVNNVLVNGSYYKENFGINNVTMINVIWDLTGIYGEHKIYVVIGSCVPSEDNITNNEGYVKLYINDRPTADNLTSSKNDVYRTNTIKIYANATDSDDNEEDLTIEILYRQSEDDQWENDYLGEPQYITDHWEVDFTPKKDAKLGMYDFGVNFTDSKGIKNLNWLIINDLVEVLNNDPEITGTIPDKSTEEDQNITFDLSNNKTDIEDDNEDLVWSTEYDDQIIKEVIITDNILTFVPAENNTENNDKITTIVEIILTDTDGGKSSQYIELTWTQILDPPAIYVNAPAFVYRTETIYIFINGSDAESEEKDLNCTLKYKNATTDWINLNVEWHNGQNGYWSAKLKTNISMDFGNQTFNITMEDPDGNVTNKLFNVDVKNNLPVVTLESSANSVLRTHTIMLYINGTDVENSEENLTCVVEFRKPFEDWEDIYLGDLTWNNTKSYWNVTFTPPKTERTIGNYEFKATITDLDNGKKNTTIIVEVMNNLPEILGIIPNPNPVEEDNDITIDFTGYESDIEDEGIKLDWYAGTYNSSAIASISGEYDPTDELTFTPVENFSGTTDVEIVLIDDDGGMDTQMITFTWTNVNDLPVIVNISLESDIDPANKTAKLKVNVTATDGDGDNITLIYEWQNASGPIQGAPDSDELDGKFFNKTDVITCKVRPFDQEGNGPSKTSNSIKIFNSGPSIKKVELSSDISPANETSTLTAIPEGYDDADGDPLWDYRYVWMNENNDTLLDGYGENQLNGNYFNKGDMVYCMVYPNDGEDDGTPVESSHIEIHNSPPYLKGVSLTPDPAGVDDTLYVVLGGDWIDLDGDIPDPDASYAYQWYYWDGDWKEIFGETSNNYSLENHNKGDKIMVVVTPDDFDDEYNIGEPKNATITISNTAPEITELEVIPDEAYTNDTLEVNVNTYYDPDDGDIITYTYQWQINDRGKWENITGQTAKTLDGWGDNFSKNDEIRVLVTAYDGTDYGQSVNSTPIVILNTKPTIDSVIIEANSKAYTNSTLTAIPIGYHDDDGDNVTEYYYSWTNQSGIVLLEGIGENKLSNDSFVKNNRIYCNVSANDGEEYGEPTMSKGKYILNTPATIEGVDITWNSKKITEAYINYTLTAEPYEWKDIDNDTVNYDYKWYINEEKTGEEVGNLDTLFLDYTKFNKGTNIILVVIPNDGNSSVEELEKNKMSTSIPILNTPPTIESVIILPDSDVYKSTEKLTAIPQGCHDNDTDALDIGQFYYNWTNDKGTLDFEGIGENELSNASFDHIDIIYCQISAYDGEEYGLPTMSNGIKILNTPATIKGVKINDTKGEITETYINDTLYAYPYGWYDIDKDTQGYICKWYKNEEIGDPVLETSNLKESLNLTNEGFKKGDTVVLVVIPQDFLTPFEEAEKNKKSTSILILNSPPKIENVIVTPSNPFTTDGLTVSYGYSDNDDDSESGTQFKWFKDTGTGFVDSGITTKTVLSENTVKGEKWKCEVTPNDGEEFGASVNSAEVTILNTPPIIENVILTPSNPFTTDDLIVSYDYSDNDTDPESGTQFKWYKDTGSGFVDSGITTKTVLSENTVKGEKWKCEVTPNDGEEYGIEKESNSVTIYNTAPTVTITSFTSSDGDEAYETSTLTVTTISDDPDPADSVELTYEWYNEGGKIASAPSSPTLTGTFFNKGDKIRVEVTPNDSESDGNTEISDSIEIKNSLPVIDKVILESTPTNATETSKLKAKVIDAHDGDNDDITFSYKWKKNGNPISGAPDSSNELSSKYFDKGDIISVSVKPNDGEDNGVEKTSNTITINNTVPTMGSVSITPDPAYNNNNLIANPSGWEDIDNDMEGYIYEWQIQDEGEGKFEKIQGEIEFQLEHTNFDKGDRLKIICWPDDGTWKGEEKEDTITIENSKPSIEEALIVLEKKKIKEAYAGDDLIAVAEGWNDLDGDEKNYKYQWQKYGNGWIDIVGAIGETFSGSKGDTIRVIIWPDDGEVYETGEIKEKISQEVKIINSKPEDVEISLEDNSKFSLGDIIELRGNAKDPDGDEFKYIWSSDKGILGEGKILSINTKKKFDENLLSMGEQSIFLTVDDSVGNVRADVIDDDGKVEVSVTIILEGAELAIEKIEFDGTIKEGKTVTIKVTVKNNGNLKADNVKVRFYYGDKLLGDDIIERISGEESTTAILEWHVEKKEGDQNIKVVVDEEDSVMEFDEKNNEMVKPINIKPEDKGISFIWILPIILIIVIVIGLYWWQTHKKTTPPTLPPSITAPTMAHPIGEPTVEEPIKPEIVTEPIPVTPIVEEEKIGEISEEEKEEAEEEIVEKGVEEEELIKGKEEVMEDEIDRELDDVDKELESISKELEELESGETWESLADLRARILEEEKEEEIDEIAKRRKELLEEEGLED